MGDSVWKCLPDRARLQQDAIRRFPVPDFTHSQLDSLLAPLLGEQGVGMVEDVEGGLTNAVLRVAPKNGGASLVLRVFLGGYRPWLNERAALKLTQQTLPVPELLLVDDGSGPLPFPSLVYRWIDGITLNSYRKRASADELLALANPLGRLVSDVSRVALGPEHLPNAPASAPLSSVDAMLARSEERLSFGRSRTRLGESLADGLWRLLSRHEAKFRTLDRHGSLVQGDLGGRNILVAPDGDGPWRIAGLVDWEDAFQGWPLWDVASFFRYPKRFSEAFRTSFAQGYEKCGTALPGDWWTTSRLLDAARQLETLNEEAERPLVFSDCRELLAAVVDDLA